LSVRPYERFDIGNYMPQPLYRPQGTQNGGSRQYLTIDPLPLKSPQAAQNLP